jgi:hypothetical protein
MPGGGSSNFCGRLVWILRSGRRSALAPGHPYLRLPVQFSVSLEPRLLRFVGRPELEELRQRAEAEIAQPGRWGTTFTLVQTWARASRNG